MASLYWSSSVKQLSAVFESVHLFFDVRIHFLSFVLPGCGLSHYSLHRGLLNHTALWMDQREKIRACRGGASEAEWR